MLCDSPGSGAPGVPRVRCGQDSCAGLVAVTREWRAALLLLFSSPNLPSREQEPVGAVGAEITAAESSPALLRQGKDKERWPGERGSPPKAPRCQPGLPGHLAVPLVLTAAPQTGTVTPPLPASPFPAFLQITYHFLSFLTTLSVFFFLELFSSERFKTSSVKRGTGELLLDAGIFQCEEPWACSGHN